MKWSIKQLFTKKQKTMKLLTLKPFRVLELVHRGVECCGKHPFATGLFALIGIIGFIFSIYGYQKDRSETEIQSLYFTGSFAAKNIGDDISVAIKSDPPQLIENYYCNWTIRPPNVFGVTYKSDNHCRISLASPLTPSDQLPDGWSRCYVKADVYRDRKQIGYPNNVLFSRENSFEYNNSGIMTTHRINTNFLKENAPIKVSILHKSTKKILPDGYSCSWNFWGQPVDFIPTNNNNCNGVIKLKSIDAFSRSELSRYKRVLKKPGGFRVNVGVAFDGIDLDFTEVITLKYQ